jgi:hypothetical protein
MEQAKKSVELIQWMANNHANQHWPIQWDPGGYRFALCNSQKWQTIPELTHLHCPEELQWSLVLCARVFWIWLVAWDVDDPRFSTSCGQAPSQGGRKATELGAFSNQIYVNHDYYIAFVNQIHVGYDFYLCQGYYFDTVCSAIIYYREDFHDDSSKTKEGRLPWDPGGAAAAWGQAAFQGGRDVRDPSWLAPSWAWALSEVDGRNYKYLTHRKEETIRLDQNEKAAASSPTSALIPHLLLACVHVSSYQSPSNSMYLCD